MRRLEGRNAIVTGAAQGLGEAIARRLAEEGCAGITVADVNLENAGAVAVDIGNQHKIKTLAWKVDVTDEAQVDRLVEETARQFGSIDILVSNAGILIA